MPRRPLGVRASENLHRLSLCRLLPSHVARSKGRSESHTRTACLESLGRPSSCSAATAGEVGASQSRGLSRHKSSWPSHSWPSVLFRCCPGATCPRRKSSFRRLESDEQVHNGETT